MKYDFLTCLGLAVSLISVQSCMEKQDSCVGKMNMTLTAAYDSDTAYTKSSIGVKDDYLTSFNVLVYSGGELVAEAYESGPSAQLELMPGTDYDFYAIANMPRMKAPEKERDLFSERMELPSWNSVSSRGFPMVYSMDKPYELKPGEDRLELQLVRLMSRYDFRLRKSMNYSDFSVQMVALKQAGYDFTPFAPESHALSCGNGDVASASDIKSLNEGKSVSFYALENCQGVLLPANTDPWKKVPSSLGKKKNVCTYLQVDGVWSSPGVSAPITYRMYLGKDNCKDFNIVRNTVNTLTLELTDEGALNSSWKVERGSVTDNRILEFAKKSLTVLPDGKKYNCSINSKPSGLNYSVEGNVSELSKAGIKIGLTGNTFHASTTSLVSEDYYTDVRLKTWDGVMKGTLTLCVPKIALETPRGVLLRPGESCTVDVTAVPSCQSTGWKVSYSSANQAVASVSASSLDGCVMGVKALAAGHTTLKASYGPLTENIDMIVPDALQKFTYSGFPSSMLASDIATVTVAPYPECSQVTRIGIEDNLDPEVLVVNSSEELIGTLPEYAEYAPYYGVFKAGTKFVLEALNPGRVTVFFSCQNPYHLEKKVISVVLGESDGQYVRCRSSQSGNEEEKFCGNECSFHLRRNDEASLEFTAARKGGLVTGVEVEQMTPLRAHSGWDEPDYYDIGEDYSKYRHCAWTVHGTDCLVTLRVTAGSNNEVIRVNLYFDS